MSEERRDSGPRGRGPQGDSDDRPRRRFGGGGGNGGSGGGGGRYYPRRKVCTFCMDQIVDIDYKDIGRLRRHVSDRGKIEPRRQSGTCAKHQRALAVAIKRARHVALIAFSQ